MVDKISNSLMTKRKWTRIF